MADEIPGEKKRGTVVRRRRCGVIVPQSRLARNLLSWQELDLPKKDTCRKKKKASKRGKKKVSS